MPTPAAASPPRRWRWSSTTASPPSGCTGSRSRCGPRTRPACAVVAQARAAAGGRGARATCTSTATGATTCCSRVTREEVPGRHAGPSTRVTPVTGLIWRHTAAAARRGAGAAYRRTVGLGGIIYGAIVVLWLCYLVPLALRRHDEAARSRSVDRFSSAMRVLGRTGHDHEPAPVSRRDPRAHAVAGPGSGSRGRAGRARSHRAAGRRPGGCPCGCGPPAPGARGAARRDRGRHRRRGRRARPALVGRDPRRAGGLLPRHRPAAGEPGPHRAPGNARCALPPPPSRRTRSGTSPTTRPPWSLDAVLEEQQVVAAPVTTVDGQSLWDPLPVTLPTYVSKPRAERSIRTVDLQGEGAWTSGHLPDAGRPDADAGAPRGAGRTGGARRRRGRPARGRRLTAPATVPGGREAGPRDCWGCGAVR